jgi:hypothetical protein
MPNLSEKPEIDKVLVVSTAHIRAQDDALLHNASTDVLSTSLVVHNLDPGYLVYGIDLNYQEEGNKTMEAELREEGFSEELLHLLQAAYTNGCDYLRLDPDGTVYDDIRRFEW